MSPKGCSHNNMSQKSCNHCNFHVCVKNNYNVVIHLKAFMTMLLIYYKKYVE
jgi:hypothetical protein